MSVEDAIVARLEAHAGVAGLVVDRIYPLEAPQDAETPYIVYQRISGVPVSNLAEDTNITDARYQLYAFSEVYGDSVDVTIQMKAALQRYKGTVASVVILDVMINDNPDLLGNDTDLHGTGIDIEISYRS